MIALCLGGFGLCFRGGNSGFAVAEIPIQGERREIQSHRAPAIICRFGHTRYALALFHSRAAQLDR